MQKLSYWKKWQVVIVAVLAIMFVVHGPAVDLPQWVENVGAWLEHLIDWSPHTTPPPPPNNPPEPGCGDPSGC